MYHIYLYCQALGLLHVSPAPSLSVEPTTKQVKTRYERYRLKNRRVPRRCVNAATRGLLLIPFKPFYPPNTDDRICSY